MNAITKKILLFGLALLPSACAHYPQHHSYYPSHRGYSSGYTIMHRNYYGERPDYYDDDDSSGKAYFPHRPHHDQYIAPPRMVPPRREHDYPDRPHHQDRDHDHPVSHESRRRHDDDSDDRSNNFGPRNRH
ncbi:MAG: hypothetical protein WAW41_07100 [Methylobacter sp.]